ncbi:MAG: GGGtGRT protein, partial [Oscillospiraceae bacterium]|nr:GGGtGRT protein [Oscillospiraceae bacterium]
MVKFEGMARRMAKIEECLKANGIENLEAAREICLSHGIDVDSIVKGVQPIAFENAVWAYTLGSAIALKKGAKDAVEAATLIGNGLQA